MSGTRDSDYLIFNQDGSAACLLWNMLILWWVTDLKLDLVMAAEDPAIGYHGDWSRLAAQALLLIKESHQVLTQIFQEVSSLSRKNENFFFKFSNTRKKTWKIAGYIKAIFKVIPVLIFFIIYPNNKIKVFLKSLQDWKLVGVTCFFQHENLPH